MSRHWHDPFDKRSMPVGAVAATVALTAAAPAATATTRASTLFQD